MPSAQSPALRLVMAQHNFMVGDIPANTDLICREAAEAAAQNADIIVFSELALTGYPPEDLLLRPSLSHRIDEALQQIADASNQVAIVVGYPLWQDGELFNAAGVWYQGQCITTYRKRCLPNYQVFDERRYFKTGDDICTFELAGQRVGLVICEDIWFDQPVAETAAAGIDLLLSLNASPYHTGKQDERIQRLADLSQRFDVPIAYINQVGGQDELVFDGGSFVVSANGKVEQQMARWQAASQLVEVGHCHHEAPAAATEITNQSTFSEQQELADLYQALVLGVRDYVNKNGFPGVVLGLSGGIDSALTLAIAVDALGADRVRAVMMPFTYTSDMSQEDAEAQAQAMGVKYQSTSIEPIYSSFMSALDDDFAGLARDTTEENLQSRCRGVILMALSNKTGAMVLTTGNKSEMAVGYATLYGDMAGGYGALKDVYKTKVFELANYRNTIAPIIPQRVIDRPPSAELAPDQIDEDSLPAYPVLDDILQRYIEQDESADTIVAAGHSQEDVMRVVRLVDINEYKRRQAPIGVRVTRRGFGRDRRYPVSNGWKPGV